MALMSLQCPFPLMPLQSPLSQAALRVFSSCSPLQWLCWQWKAELCSLCAGLEADLHGQLHGQHLAKEVVVQAVRGFLQSPGPQKALVLSFHGWSGTGKNFVARLVASHLYRDGLKSDCVRVFVSLLHFPHHNYVDSYKVRASSRGWCSVWAGLGFVSFPCGAVARVWE